MSALPPDVSPGAPGASGAEPVPSPEPAPVAPPAPRPGFSFDRSGLLATIVVGAIVAGVTLGGIGLDRAIAAPSAGQVALQSVHIAAEPGWMVVPPPDGEQASDTEVELQKGDVVLAIFHIADGYSGDRESLLSDAEQSLDDGSADIQFQQTFEATLGGDVDVSSVGFTAILNSQTLDGELLATVYYGNAVVFEAFAPQGDLDIAQHEIETMVGSLELTQ